MRDNDTHLLLDVEAGALRIDEMGRIWRLGRWVCPRGINPRLVVYPTPIRAESLHSGYYMVNSSQAGVRYRAMAHRVVFLYLVDQIPRGWTVNHLNGDTLDNRPSNLEAVSYSDNIKHSFAVLGKAPNVTTAKLNRSNALAIRNRWVSGESMPQLAQAYGVCIQTISNVCNYRTWKD